MLLLTQMCTFLFYCFYIRILDYFHCLWWTNPNIIVYHCLNNNVYVCVCARVCVRACVLACMCVRACVRACVCVCVCVCKYISCYKTSMFGRSFTFSWCYWLKCIYSDISSIRVCCIHKTTCTIDSSKYIKLVNKFHTTQLSAYTLCKLKKLTQRNVKLSRVL